MKWLIVEDALRDRKGHWLEYVSTFVRDLRALEDEVVVLCDRRADGFVMERTGALPVLPESIWHRMGDGAGVLKRYLRVPGHAIETFFAMRRVFKGFNHNRARGQVRERATGGLPEGRVSGNERVKGHGGHRGFSHGDTANTAIEAGQCLDKPSGAAFLNPFASELVRDSENTALSRSASGPALATEPPIADERPLIADGSKLVSSSTTEKALDAGRWSLDSCEAPDWIFVPTLLVHHLLGWWLLLKTGSVLKESRVLLFFPNLPIRLDDAGEPHWTAGPTTKLMAWLFSQLRGEVASEKVVLGVETHAMRRALEGLIRTPVVYLPHPVPAKPPRTDGGPVEYASHSMCERGLMADGLKLVPNSATGNAFEAGRSTIDTEASGSPILFGCYGAARWEKGSDIFQEAIKLILKDEVASKKWRVASVDDNQKLVSPYSLPATAAGRPLRFAIQWVEDFLDEDGNLVSIDPRLRGHSQVEVIGRNCEGDEYEGLLAQTDVMVLPYRSPYRLRVSRVVIEAMLNGMVVIATRGTTLFEQAEEYGVVVGCEEGNAESLAGAMLEAAKKFKNLRSTADEKAVSINLEFSVKHFREGLNIKGLS